MFDEAEVFINGQRLSLGQSMALRVAISQFLDQLNDAEFLKDLGEIGPAYYARASEIIKLMVSKV